jgi:hypothetical protein
VGVAPHPITQEMPVRRLTLEEYFAYWFSPLMDERDERLRQVMERRRQELAAVMRDGDELWEWKAGPHVFAEHGGLVVLRDGQVIWTSMDWRS